MTRARAVTASVAAGIGYAALAPVAVVGGVGLALWAAWQQRKASR